MKKIAFSAFALLGLSGWHPVFSQSDIFFKSGTVEYERTQNIMATFNHDPRLQGYVDKTGSEIYTSFFTLTILPDQTLYQFSKNNGRYNQFPEMPADINTVYYDLKNKKKVVQKNINGKEYTITNEARNLEWKLTDERRTIAGYDCRRANTLLFDSIYVVAFFCDKFIPQVGPESFGGLPGLILGLAIPNEHISWFAKKVTPMENLPPITPSIGANPISTSEFHTLLETKIRPIPKFGFTMYKRALL